MAIDREIPIEKVSRAMRHKSTKTTEEYYARVRRKKAFADIKAAFRVSVQN